MGYVLYRHPVPPKLGAAERILSAKLDVHGAGSVVTLKTQSGYVIPIAFWTDGGGREAWVKINDGDRKSVV